MKEHQARVGTWIAQTGEIPVGYQEAYLGGEYEEFQHEWDNGRDPEKLQGELADIAIALLGIAHQYGFDLGEAVEKKMEVVDQKYNPQDISYFIDRGYTREQAMAACKRIWERQQGLIELPK